MSYVNLVMFHKNGLQRLVSTSYTTFQRNSSNNSMKYCMDAVRQCDYENFISTLLLDKNIVPAAMVVRAFNVEMSKVKENVSDEKIGFMRFQFWIDTLEKIFSKDTNIPAHPIAQQLYLISLQHNLTKRNLMKLINSRKINFSKKYFLSIEEMEKYSEESVSPLYYSILELANVKNVHADHAASHIGKAQGIANLLRSVQVSAKQRVVLLPQDILIKHNISQESILRGESSQNLKDAVFDIATRANHHIIKARSISVPSEAKTIFLPAVAVSSYLKKLEKYDFSLFDPKLNVRNSILPVTLYWNKIRSKY